ncbi:helix-turn-helix domain-containing protein [Pseudonocardia asaccharolytica]|uniref:helix-turn-helix domain-containing protein n=1 Tax=Pseudonocardia asaccharolytica TaxID=54010 RepID=UPI00048BCBF5|nr:XRE family transcriptional regulator [Pseudonocardia asaccharolytica]
MNGSAMVGRNVRRIRHERRLSLGGLAQAAGLAKQTLANLENGTGNPTIETLFAVARALDVGVTWLLTEWGTPVYVQRRRGRMDPERHRRVRTLDQTYGSGQVTTFVMELVDGRPEVLPALPTGALLHVFVVAGSVVAGPVGQETTVAEGDFIRFPGDLPHLFRCTSGRAVLHVVTTVPQVQQFASG